MRHPLILLCVLMVSCLSEAKKNPEAPVAMPTDFVVGVRTFWDFGPPFNYYDLFIVRPTESGARIDRITLTPPGQACFQPAKVEVASGSTTESIDSLLQNANPCEIPEKVLRREAKRCKKCQTFSGADLTMQARCGNQDRLIRADIFEDYWFDRKRTIPEHTSRIMQVVDRLNGVVGMPDVKNKTMFDLSDRKTEGTGNLNTEVRNSLSGGTYDSLFQTTTEKPSDLYRVSQIPPPTPTIHLLSSSPFRPQEFLQPQYPVIAKLARVEGNVVVTFEIDSNGKTRNIEVESGHPMLRGAVTEAVTKWKFPPDAASQRNRATLEFKTNCPTPR